ncbi:MAG: ABC transporter permease [Candidatus Hydrogenedentota bacterium]|nr:MAG: ABC transporter permease [Candidatus Hydrogenedentota bacterium]
MKTKIITFVQFMKNVIKLRETIWTMAKRDLKVRYLGSYLGILWAFIQPLVTIAVMWFIFDIGFKSKPVGNMPFILWLITAMFPWFYFSETILAGTTVIRENAYLVQKVVFPVSILPIVKIISGLFIHAFFISIMFIAFIGYGYPPTIHAIQVLYYLGCVIVLILGFTWMSSSIDVFFRDLGQIINVGIQIGFWATPVFWPPKMLPPKIQPWLKLNPVYYITEGYRNAMIHHVWFWEDWLWTLYFWAFTTFLFFFGAWVFRKLRPHFADVL